MTRNPGTTSKSLLAAAAALVLALLLVVVPSQALAGSGGVGPGGTGTGGSGTGTKSGGSAGEIEGLSPSYTKFSKRLAGKTGLSLRVIGGWTLAEGGPKDNPLNIGPGKTYGTVGKGVRATSTLLRHSLYRDVMASVGEPDSAQIAAIADSPWCPGCRGYKRLLKSTYRSVQVKP